jgi:Flp pilus assembly pilin Flp
MSVSFRDAKHASGDRRLIDLARGQKLLGAHGAENVKKAHGVRHEPGGCPRRLNHLVRIGHEDQLHRLLTEIAMGGPPLWQHRIKGKAGAVFALIADETGVTAIEYTLIAALIAMAFVALITQLGDFVSAPFETIAGKL